MQLQAPSQGGRSASAGNVKGDVQTNHDLPPHSDDVEEERRRVLLAIGAVYSTQPNGQVSAIDPVSQQTVMSRDAADRYLQSFQRQPVSWMVCDRILGPNGVPSDDPGAAVQARFIAAQTFLAKCRTDVTQLPPEQLPSLRDSLMNHLTTHSLGGANRALVTRLGLALSALAVQMGWYTIIPDVFNTVLGPRPELAPAVMDLFKLLPEECCSGRLVLADESRRREFGGRLRDCSGQIMEFLLQMAQSSTNDPAGNRTREGALQTLHSWVRYVEMPPSLLESSPLVEWTFSFLEVACAGDSSGHHYHNGDAFETAVDVVVELLRQYPSDPRENTGLVQRMIPLAMLLGRPSDDGPFRKALRDDDEDATRGYCRIFTEMGESYMSLIMSHEDLDQAKLVDLVLDCSAIPDREVATITLHFWYRFVSCLESLEPMEYRYMMIDQYASQLLRLLSICSSLLCYPADIDTLTEDRVEDINRERYFVAETVEDCCRLLGGHAVLLNLGKRLKEECHKVSSLSPQQQLSEWHGIESCLYAMQSVSRYIGDDEDKILPFIMDLIPRLPPDVPQMRCTANLTVGKYALWLDSHTAHLQPLMPYLAQGLSVPRCASSAAIAIKELCESCNKHLSLGDPVLDLYDGIIAAQQQSMLLDLRDELEVLEGACKAISRQLMDQAASGQPDTSSNYTNRLVQPIGTRLAAIAAPEGSYHPKQATTEVERLTVIIRYLDLPRVTQSAGAAAIATASGIQMLSAKATFVLNLTSESWNLLEAISQKYPHDIHLAEKLCRLHKHTLRGCGAAAYRPMLEPLCTQLVRNFTASTLSPYLYAASICVSEYCRDAEAVPLLFRMLSDMSTAVFGLLHSPDKFTAHPDVVEEFFFLGARMMSNCPEPLVMSPLLNHYLKYASEGMKLDHRDANSGTLNFIENTISYGLTLRDEVAQRPSPNQLACKGMLEKAIVSEGQAIIINMAASLLGDLPLYRLDNGRGSIAGILFKLNDLCPDLLMQWLDSALVPAPGQAKDEFLRSFAIRVPRDKFDSSVRQFTSICDRTRKLRGVSSAHSARRSI